MSAGSEADRELDLHDHCMIAASCLMLFPKTELREITATIEDQLSGFVAAHTQAAVAGMRDRIAELEAEERRYCTANTMLGADLTALRARLAAAERTASEAGKDSADLSEVFKLVKNERRYLDDIGPITRLEGQDCISASFLEDLEVTLTDYMARKLDAAMRKGEG